MAAIKNQSVKNENLKRNYYLIIDGKISEIKKDGKGEKTKLTKEGKAITFDVFDSLTGYPVDCFRKISTFGERFCIVLEDNEGQYQLEIPIGYGYHFDFIERAVNLSVFQKIKITPCEYEKNGYKNKFLVIHVLKEDGTEEKLKSIFVENERPKPKKIVVNGKTVNDYTDYINLMKDYEEKVKACFKVNKHDIEKLKANDLFNE